MAVASESSTTMRAIGKPSPSSAMLVADIHPGSLQYRHADRGAIGQLDVASLPKPRLGDFFLAAVGHSVSQSLDDDFRQLGSRLAIRAVVLGTRFPPNATSKTMIRETAARHDRCSSLCNTCDRNAHNVSGGV